MALKKTTKLGVCLQLYLGDPCFAVLFPEQANKIIEHRRKYERKREEREIKERQERVKKAREEHEKAQRVSGRTVLIRVP